MCQSIEIGNATRGDISHAGSSTVVPFGITLLDVLCAKKIQSTQSVQEMTKREYVEDQDAEDPDDFIISLTTQVCDQ